MGDFLVDADAGRTRKIIDLLRGGYGPFPFKETRTDLVQLGSGHARLHRVFHRLNRVGHDAADDAQALQLVFLCDGNGRMPSDDFVFVE